MNEFYVDAGNRLDFYSSVGQRDVPLISQRHIVNQALRREEPGIRERGYIYYTSSLGSRPSPYSRWPDPQIQFVIRCARICVIELGYYESSMLLSVSANSAYRPSKEKETKWYRLH